MFIAFPNWKLLQYLNNKMGKIYVICSHNGTLLINKKECTSGIPNNIDGSQIITLIKRNQI